ncbi:MAG: dihydroneopterin aldolase [Parvularculaceae bacterium]|nr:dihydroneopterin aldolase [Parvularculaceae bacterium]
MNRPLLNADHYYIVLDRYRLDVSIGIHEFERAKPQPVTVSIAVAFRRRKEYQDRISEVIDYDFLRAEIAALVHDRHINLQETLCEAVLAICRKGGARGAIVRSEKTNVYPDAHSVGCEMSWFDEGVLFGS